MAEAMLSRDFRLPSSSQMGSNSFIEKSAASSSSSINNGSKKCLTSCFASTDSFGKRRRCSSNNVLFSLPTVSKRQRMVKPSDELVSRVAEGIKKAVSRSDRLSALGAACATFDHDIAATHDEEIQTHGVDAALCKHLGFLFHKKKRLESSSSSRTNGNNDVKKSDDEITYGVVQYENNIEDIVALEEEIGYTCMAMEMVFRCSASTLAESFSNFGHDLLELLLLVLDPKTYDEVQKSKERKKDDNSNDGHQQLSLKHKVPSWEMAEKEHSSSSSSSLTQIHHVDYARTEKEKRHRSEFLDLSRSKSTRIMCHLARVGSATEPIANHPGVLRTLQSIIDSGSNSDNNNNNTSSSSGKDNNIYKNEARINSLWVLANLACAPGNMITIARYPKMLDSLLNVIQHCDDHHHRTTKDKDGVNIIMEKSKTRNIAARGQAVRVILNLSWKDENKLQMSDMPTLIRTLSGLIAIDGECTIGRAARMVVRSTRRHAAGALRNIAAVACQEHKRNLCRMSHLLDVLAMASSSSTAAANNGDRDLREGGNDDVDCEVMERALAALHNLCCETTAVILGNHPGLLDVLERAADITAGDYHMQSVAEKALKILARYADDRMKCHNAIRQALELARTKDNNNNNSSINGSSSNNNNNVNDHNLENGKQLRTGGGVVDNNNVGNVNEQQNGTKREKILKHLPHLEI